MERTVYSFQISLLCRSQHQVFFSFLPESLCVAIEVSLHVQIEKTINLWGTPTDFTAGPILLRSHRSARRIGFANLPRSGTPKQFGDDNVASTPTADLIKPQLLPGNRIVNWPVRVNIRLDKLLVTCCSIPCPPERSGRRGCISAILYGP